MKTDIIIVNWNSGVQLRECVESVRRYHGGLLGKCIVVDNGSSDGSADFLDDAGDVTLVRAGENLGFGKACNLGARQGESPFILLLNPDARLLEETLPSAVAVLQDPAQAQIGIVGVQLTGADGAIQRTCARAPTPALLLAKSFGLSALFKSADFHMTDWDHRDTRLVDHVIGAFLLTRRNLYDKLSGMDERFFVYLEDLDFSMRMSALGYHTLYLAHVQAFHKGGGVSENVKAHRLFYSLRSRIQYSFKHFSGFGALLTVAATLFVEPFTRLAQLVVTRRWSELSDLTRGYRMLWGWSLDQSRLRLSR